MLFFGTLHSDVYIFPFLLCFSFLFFSQLFVRPPQAAILLFLHFISMGIVLIPVSCTMSRTSVHSSSVVSNSVRPYRRQHTRLPRPWNSSVKNTGVGFHILLQCMKLKSESEVTQLCRTLATPWTAAHQAPPSMGFSRQEYWSGVPLPSPIFTYNFSIPNS